MNVKVFSLCVLALERYATKHMISHTYGLFKTFYSYTLLLRSYLGKGSSSIEGLIGSEKGG